MTQLLGLVHLVHLQLSLGSVIGQTAVFVPFTLDSFLILLLCSDGTFIRLFQYDLLGQFLSLRLLLLLLVSLVRIVDLTLDGLFL